MTRRKHMRRRIPRTIAAVVGQMWCQRYLMAGLVDSLRARAAAPKKNHEEIVPAATDPSL
jgi:hypothetical protein